MDYDKFIYEKKQYISDGSVTYYWYLINKKLRNGVHFHGIGFDSRDKCDYDFDLNNHNFRTYGLEIHSSVPKYDGHKALKNCHVTCGDCYCDGTSSLAREELGFVDPKGFNDFHIWVTLEWFYKKHFEADEEQNDQT